MAERSFDSLYLLSRFSELDVFPPGFILQCPVCHRHMPPASETGSAQLLQCQHRDHMDVPGEPSMQMAQDGKCYTINTRGVAFGGPNLKDLQVHIRAWGQSQQGVDSLARWKSTMTPESEATYWAALAENKMLVEAGAQAAQQAAQQATVKPTRVGTIDLAVHIAIVWRC